MVRRPRSSPLLLLLWLRPTPPAVLSLSRAPPSPSVDRRGFVAAAGAASLLIDPPSASALKGGGSDVASLLDAATISWDGPPWPASRYRASTLSSSTSNRGDAPASGRPVFYPGWMARYYATKYKFLGASFPQGRKVLSLRTAGAGLGSCLSLPNVGYVPPAPHATRFILSDDGSGAYEDLAYNLPRRFEAFWPQAKVLAVRTNGGLGDGNRNNLTALTPRCTVAGEGCSSVANPKLHLPASRAGIEFDGPTRRGGRRVQSSDVTVLDHSVQIVDGGRGSADECCCVKSYSQYNPEQELQTFYREVTSFRRVENGDVVGRIRVAAFLPEYLNDVAASAKIGGRGGAGYSDTNAVAMYDYETYLRGADEAEALSL